jgi:hypothetical protein
VKKTQNNGSCLGYLSGGFYIGYPSRIQSYNLKNPNCFAKFTRIDNAFGVGILSKAWLRWVLLLFKNMESGDVNLTKPRVNRCNFKASIYQKCLLIFCLPI